MNLQRIEVDLYVELLYQVKEGNTDEDTISEKVKLSKQSVSYALKTLHSRNLLKKTKQRNKVTNYNLTTKGIKFIEYIPFPDKLWKT